MAAQKKPVVIVEDMKAQRDGLIETLSRYEFAPIAGETISQTLALLREYKDDAAVIIIDMDMSKFPDYDEQVRKEGSEITGTGLAKRVLRETKLRRPEVIIYSIYSDRAEYYKQAIEAGASAYSNKSDDSDRGKFLSMVHALALKHAFQPNQLNDAEMAGLAEGHANAFELLEYFYRNKLARELTPCLAGAPHILLIRDKTGGGEVSGEAAHLTSVYTNAEGVPGPGEFDYAELHRRVSNQRKLDQLARYSIYSPEADLFAGGAADRLKEFVFIELVNVAEVEMTLGISHSPPRDVLGVYPLSTQSLAEALLEHASPALETFVQQLLFRWREKQSVKVESVKTSVGLSGSVQRRLGPLVRDQRLTASAEMSEPVRDLRQLSDDISEYGQTLSALLEGSRSAAAGAGARTARLSDIVREIQTDYDRLGHFDEILFNVSADCVAPAERYYFSQALRALVSWAFQRRAKVAGGGKQDVQVGCTLQGRWLEVSFRENSVRLSKRLRESYLFEPLSPLRVAQMIIEVACHGRLIDATDELPGETGHLFKIRLLQN